MSETLTRKKRRDLHTTTIPAFQNEWDQKAEYSNKGSRRNKDVSDWRLIIRDATGMFWMGNGWTTDLWSAKVFTNMVDAREDFPLVKAHGGRNIGVKRVRLFCAERNPKHVIEGIAP